MGGAGKGRAGWGAGGAGPAARAGGGGGGGGGRGRAGAGDVVSEVAASDRQRGADRRGSGGADGPVDSRTADVRPIEVEDRGNDRIGDGLRGDGHRQRSGGGAEMPHRRPGGGADDRCGPITEDLPNRLGDHDVAVVRPRVDDDRVDLADPIARRAPQGRGESLYRRLRRGGIEGETGAVAGQIAVHPRAASQGAVRVLDRDEGAPVAGYPAVALGIEGAVGLPPEVVGPGHHLRRVDPRHRPPGGGVVEAAGHRGVRIAATHRTGRAPDRADTGFGATGEIGVLPAESAPDRPVEERRRLQPLDVEQGVEGLGAGAAHHRHIGTPVRSPGEQHRVDHLRRIGDLLVPADVQSDPIAVESVRRRDAGIDGGAADSDHRQQVRVGHIAQQASMRDVLASGELDRGRTDPRPQRRGVVGGDRTDTALAVDQRGQGLFGGCSERADDAQSGDRRGRHDAPPPTDSSYTDSSYTDSSFARISEPKVATGDPSTVTVAVQVARPLRSDRTVTCISTMSPGRT